MLKEQSTYGCWRRWNDLRRFRRQNGTRRCGWMIFRCFRRNGMRRQMTRGCC